MMSSYLRNERQATRRRLIVATVVVVLVVTVDLLSGGIVRGFVRTTTSVVWGIGSRAMSAVVSSGFFSTRHALQSENQLLKREVAQLQSRIAGLEKSEEENAQLRDLVGMIQGPVGVTAPIVSSTRSSPYGTFLVGAGKVDGVVEGSIVMAGSSERGFVIGEVSDVQEHLSLVTEIFAPAVEIEASINGAPIVLKGQGGGNARGDTPRAVTVDVGDSVVAPSLGGRLIGVVGAVSSDPTDVYQRVYVRIPANFSTLQFVYVVPRPQ